MDDRLQVHGLDVDRGLHDLVVDEVLPGTGVGADDFWRGLSDIVAACTPRNRELLARRDELQSQLDEWHREHGAGTPEQVRDFLASIGYLVEPPDDVRVTTTRVDRELAEVAGPQLVVPVDNARYALNAANARWGSLYDALYGTDALGEPPAGSSYDPARGRRVIARAREVLDLVAPLATGSWADAAGLSLQAGELLVAGDGGDQVGLAQPARFVGVRGSSDEPTGILLRHHGLHVEVVVDRDHPVGRDDAAGIADVVLEAAVTTIADLEDSVAVVDAADKVRAYRNWLGLMDGTLTTPVTKQGRTFERRLAEDREWREPRSGEPFVLPGRAVLLVRNVGIHMTTPAVRDAEGNDVHEGLLDALVTAAAALHDIGPNGRRANSRAGAVHVVKPKLHGPDEVAFAVDVFERVEDVLGMARGTITIGIMDEERRTTVNLAACVAAAADRVVFINTGFLDRTGDEIHSVMEAGPVVAKGDMKDQGWIDAYERWNVDVGLACGLAGRGQIGKGMWAEPNNMHAMLEAKGAQPRAGATTAWVPSPTAATLHALHYHEVDVAAVLDELANRPPARLEELLVVPVLDEPLDEDVVARELRDNAQSILGYVVRWIDQGVGCSTVPDIDDVGKMEDRATLRISSQLLANWLHHGLITRGQLDRAFVEVAAVVDRQNAPDPAHLPLAPDPDGSIAFRAARELVLRGLDSPNGYTEPVLHEFRRRAKAAHGP